MPGRQRPLLVFVKNTTKQTKRTTPVICAAVWFGHRLTDSRQRQGDVNLQQQGELG